MRSASEPEAATPPASASNSARNGNGNGDGMKAYDEVITDDMETDDGLFTLHREQEKLYFEIADSLLGREVLLVSRIAKMPQNMRFGGAGMKARSQQVVRWERQYDRLLLRHVSYEGVASDTLPVYQAVRNNYFEPILAAFDIETRSEDSTTSVIEVTDLFAGDVPLISPLSQNQRQQFEVRRFDGDRSFITSARSFPENVEVRHILSYVSTNPPDDGATGTISVEMNQSMILLPADPMMPRNADPRVGFYTVQQIDYGSDRQTADTKSFITRWRLECDGPRDAQGLCTPKKPIVYYIDPATPDKWRPYLKQGVDDWKVAFEGAGFRDAIRAADPPSAEENSDWSPEDVRYSVIRYIANPIQNAQGPHVHDPRTGEILESDILWYHAVQNILRSWFFVQTGAHNPEARTAQMSDEVMGELIRYVAAHEVGHTLGMPHNWGASYGYPVDSLRSATFTAQYGVSPSIMDYSRFNYVRQPEDEGVTIIPFIGPYDIHAVTWGYRPIDSATSPDAEKATLNQWIREHEDDPMYFYGRQTSTAGQVDPRSQREDIGDDAMKASGYGLANLERVADNMVDWIGVDGERYNDLANYYGALTFHWNLFTGHVARYIGGVYETPKTYDQDGYVYEPVPEDKQREAMAFLQAHVFEPPTWIINPDILARIEQDGAVERMRGLQSGVLNLVLHFGRLARMIEAEARLGDDAYTMAEMMAELRTGIWSELRSGDATSIYRRNLQRSYLERLDYLMTAEHASVPAAAQAFMAYSPINVSQSDIRPVVRGELTTLRSDVNRALRRTSDTATRLHLQDVLVRIDDILEGDD